MHQLVHRWAVPANTPALTDPQSRQEPELHDPDAKADETHSQLSTFADP